MPASTPPDWDERYRTGDAPWDSGIRSRELARVLDEEAIPPGRAAELGCGTGTNTAFLAQRGFDVTAFDISKRALHNARNRVMAEGIAAEFVEADLCRLAGEFEPFDFLFDRGCYHCARRIDLAGFKHSLEKLSRPGTLYLVLTGNANEQSEEGIPRLYDHEIWTELEDLFEFRFIREIHFEDAGGVQGPLGWSCLLERRASS